LQEVPGRVRAVDFEAVVRTAVGRRQPEVVEDGPDVEQFGIDRQPPVAAANGPEQVNPKRVGEQKRGAMPPEQFGRLPGELTVWDPNPCDGLEHENPPDSSTGRPLDYQCREP